MGRAWILVLGVMVAASGCGDDETGSAARACATDIEVGEVQAFGEETPLNTEGITFDTDGKLFVSAQDTAANDQLLDISRAGTSESVAEDESILGLESHANGIIAAGIRTGKLLLIDPETRQVDTITDQLGEPNFVVTTAWDTILVSDDRSGESTIYEVTWEGDVSTWVDGIPSPNGMVFSLDGSTLYVATTFEDPPGLWRVPVMGEGSAGAPDKWVTFPSGSTPDGVAIDSEGNVYVSLNVRGEIAKVDTEGNDSIVATGVRATASIAFGQGDFDPCSIYSTNLFGTQLWRVGIGVLGVEK